MKSDKAETAAAIGVALLILLAWIAAGLFALAWVTVLPSLGLAWLLGWLA
jgi:hypothetical protein